MEKLQFENNNFSLYSPDSLNYITNNLGDILNDSLSRYKELFDIEDFRKVQINFFDDIDKFRSFIVNLRQEDNLPKYAKGTFDRGMINAYIEPNVIVGTPMYMRRKYLASHELFHIMYKELVWESKDRITWFDEGMAQFFSLEYEKEMTVNFDNWFNKLLDKTVIIPNLNELSHASNFMTSYYSGYQLSLLAVKYLFDILSEEEFKKLIWDNDKILEYGNTVLNSAINYYKNNTIKQSR